MDFTVNQHYLRESNEALIYLTNYKIQQRTMLWESARLIEDNQTLFS